MRFANKIGLSAATAALIIGPLLGAAVFFQARFILQERIIQEQVQSARGIMREIDTAMYHAYQGVSTIAADELLAGFLESPSNRAMERMVADELEERERLTGPWDALAVFDADGHAVIAPKPLGDETAISAYVTSVPGFQRALNGEINYTDRVVRRRTGMPVVIFAAPVYGQADRSRVVGVVVAHYRWAEVQGILDHTDPAATVHLLDRAGAVIARRSVDTVNNELTAPAERVVAEEEKSGYAIATHDSHGAGEALKVEVAQGGVQDYRGSGWRLALEQPSDKVFAPIRRMAMATAMLVFAVLLVLAGLYSLIGRHFLRPLGELVRGVRQVAGGKLDSRLVVRSEDEFGELAANFNTMIDKLRAAQDALVKREKQALLGQVAASVGHELRNPLAAMSNAVYFLQSTDAGSDADVKEYLGIIRDEIARSERIVTDLTDAVQTRPPMPASHGVAVLVEQVLRKCVPPAGVTVRLDIPATLPAVRVDASQIRQAFENLVGNAVDAMPEGGVLEIRAAADGKAVIVSVRDSGGGIAPADMARLFQPLFTTKARGIGLGLVVARNLVEANGGTVEAASIQGKGTVFSVTLPAADHEEK